MSNLVSRIVVVMIPILLAISVNPVLAVEYAPGVSVGQYVKYNAAGGPAPYPQNVTIDWLMLEVVEVSGSDVSLRSSGQYTNGSATSNPTITIYNVENGTSNGTTYNTYGPIIAANLNEGDAIPPLSYGLKINKTETRTYLGVSRSVNILNVTTDFADYASKMVVFYDRASGMTLEGEYEYTQKKPTQTTTKASIIVIETNIFTSPTVTPTPTSSPTAAPTPPPTPTSTLTPTPTMSPTPTLTPTPSPTPSATPTPTPTVTPTVTPTPSPQPQPVDYTMYYVIGGIIAVMIIAGIVMLMRRK